MTSTSCTKKNESSNDDLGIIEKKLIVSLSFMSLSEIPEIKLNDKGLFDVTMYEFIYRSIQ